MSTPCQNGEFAPIASRAGRQGATRRIARIGAEGEHGLGSDLCQAGEERPGLRDTRQRVGGALCLRDACGVARGADKDEIVVHDLVALDPVARADKGLLGRPGMHQHHVDITTPSQLQRLARTDGNDMHPNVEFMLEYRLDSPSLYVISGIYPRFFLKYGKSEVKVKRRDNHANGAF